MINLTVGAEVAMLTLCRPRVNAISEEWVRQFDARIDELISRSDWKVLHIRSDQKVFCAGADLKEVRERMQVRDGPDRMYAFVAGIQRLYARIEHLPQVSVAEIAGAALGGGLELALACDLRIAANEAQLGLPEARLGLIPGAGGTQRLTRLCGAAVAARLILSAELIDGSTAQHLGIVQWAVGETELGKRTTEIIRSIAALPADALAASKALIAAAAGSGRGGYAEELEATRRLLSSMETRQRVEEFLAGAAPQPTRDVRGAVL